MLNLINDDCFKLLPTLADESIDLILCDLPYNEGNRHPKTIQKFSRERERLHPTQKPVALLEFLIKSYTQPNDLVLDCVMGSGSTGVAAKNLGRKFIGIERDDEYFEIAKTRLFKGGIGLGIQEEFNL